MPAVWHNGLPVGSVLDLVHQALPCCDLFPYRRRAQESIMSVSNDSTAFGTIDNERALLLSIFTEFCTKLRNNDPSILPELSEPLRINCSSEKEHMELADALLENTNVTYLQLWTADYTEGSAEAMAKYMRTSKRLQRILCCSLVWPEKEHHSTRAHTGILAGRNGSLSYFYQFTRPSSPSKAMFAWVYYGSDWTRDFVANRHFQNHGT